MLFLRTETKEITYDPMKNPDVIAKFEADKKLVDEANHKIDSLESSNAAKETYMKLLENKINNSNDRINTNRKKLEEKKHSIDNMDEAQLEEDINKKLGN